MKLRVASFNVLASAYLHLGDYAARGLLQPHVRLLGLLEQIDNLQADIIGIQEAEPLLVQALDARQEWQICWSQKSGGQPDGCLILARRIINAKFTTRYYNDGSGHLAQMATIGDTVFANTHLLYGGNVPQATQLLDWLGATQAAVVLADCNDRPGGPVRALFTAAGFWNTCGTAPTALIGREPAALDLLAVRGIPAEPIPTRLPQIIPSPNNLSDHIPVIAEIEIR